MTDEKDFTLKITVPKEFDGIDLELALAQCGDAHAYKVLSIVYKHYVTAIGEPQWSDKFPTPVKEQTMPTYATIEQGTTEYLARILEPGKEPYYFVPRGIFYNIVMGTSAQLQRAVLCSFPDAIFTSEEYFNRKVEGK